MVDRGAWVLIAPARPALMLYFLLGLLYLNFWLSLIFGKSFRTFRYGVRSKDT